MVNYRIKYRVTTTETPYSALFPSATRLTSYSTEWLFASISILLRASSAANFSGNASCHRLEYSLIESSQIALSNSKSEGFFQPTFFGVFL